MQILMCRGWHSQRGAVASEYALLIGLIALVAFGGIAFVGSSTQGKYDESCREVATALGGPSC